MPDLLHNISLGPLGSPWDPPRTPGVPSGSPGLHVYNVFYAAVYMAAQVYTAAALYTTAQVYTAAAVDIVAQVYTAATVDTVAQV